MQMVRERWYIVLEADEVPRDRPLGAQRFGEDLVFWRDATGAVRCASARCPHRGASLALGSVHEGQIACPFHGFRFRGTDGRCAHIPANGEAEPSAAYDVPVHTALERHGFVWLWWGEPRDDVPEPPWFPELDDPRWRWKAGRLHDDWPIHWTRVVENQLDFAHLPFVHATSIGRFVQTPVMDVEIETDGVDYLKTWVSNQEAGSLELHAPNLWRNRLGEKASIVAVFVPINEGTTRTYIRYYQRQVTLPVVADLFGWVMRWANLWILSQDKVVVSSQRPAEAHLGNGDRLIAADAPIAWFRAWRHRASKVAPERQDPPAL